MASRVIVELAEHIKARFNLYSSALRADLAHMRKTHGTEPVREALGMVDELRDVAIVGQRRPSRRGQPRDWSLAGAPS
jgi:hypothetical protein